MKQFKIILLIIAVLFLSTKLNSQELFGIECGTVSNNSEQLSNPFYGLYKTIRTDTAYNGVTPSDAVFPVIIVFVQFKNDINYSDWKTDSAPSYYSTMIAQVRNNNPSWWEAYNPETQSISSYWAEVSRGKLHIIGNAYSIVLDSDVNYYNSLGNQVAEITINAEIWQKLDGYIQDWSAYDKWSYTSVNNEIKFIYQRDNKIDMIYKIHKTVGNCLKNYDGYSSLATESNLNSSFIVQDSIYILYGWYQSGSGLTVSRLHKKNDIIGTITHEHGHYLYASGHLVHGKMVYICGFDYFYSPYEMILNGYMKPRYGSYGNYESLGDYSSRNAGDGEILKVRIDSINFDEYFLIANRRKVSKWDRVMLGDTTKYDIFSESDYGKGIYIYHVFDGIREIAGNPSVPHDLECADGLWQWTNLGKVGIVDLNCWTGFNFYQFRRDSVIYEHDQVSIGENTFRGDGISLNFLHFDTTANVNKYTTNIFGIGQRPSNNCLLGTDRLYTNSEEYYTNNENQGDRWDAWNIGYNEIFSPYSSPNTNNVENNSTGIFIWYGSLYGNTAFIRIYRTSVSTPLDSILKWTPPSRPMGLKVDVTDCIDYRRYPVLTWNQNMEPDMVQSGMKRYKIFRAWDAMENVPGNYEEIADTLFDADTNIATFIDFDTYAQCDDGTAEENYRLRYKVKAVDIYEDISVYSDFVSISTYYLNRGDGEGGDAIFHKNLTYELSQNYPNPFNPVTNIQFSIPINGFVKLTVYDILGREVKNLINEFKHAGSYIVSFDGSALASGIYFYRLESGNFVQVKRMIILK